MNRLVIVPEFDKQFLPCQDIESIGERLIMAIYPEFIPPIKDYIKLITSRQFDKVRYGNDQPIADSLQKLIYTFTDPYELGGLGRSFKEPEDSDFDDVLMFRVDNNRPRLVSDEGECIEWTFDNEDYPNLEDMPPLEISLPSSSWHISGIQIFVEPPPGALSLSVGLLIDNYHFFVYLLEIIY